MSIYPHIFWYNNNNLLIIKNVFFFVTKKKKKQLFRHINTEYKINTFYIRTLYFLYNLIRKYFKIINIFNTNLLLLRSHSNDVQTKIYYNIIYTFIHNDLESLYL